MTSTATTERPAAFDDAVLQWLPLLRKLANRLERDSQDRDDVVQETVESALANWQTYDDKGLAGWLTWRMRGVISDRKRKRDATVTVDEMPEGTTAPNQEQAVDLGAVVRSLSGITCPQQTAEQLAHANDVVLRIATGDTMAEIAAESGCSRRNVHQIYRARQKRIRQKFGVAA